VSQFDRVLVPLDGSSRAEAGLRWVKLLPVREVRLLHVCPAPDTLCEGKVHYLDDVAARLRPAVAIVATRIDYGRADETIVAEAADTDLIVMSTQGEGGGGRRLYGSVADRVARHAPVPTLLARAGLAPIEAAPLRRVVVPLDGSSAAQRALPMAERLARMLHAPVHLIAVSEASASDSDPLHLHLAEQAAAIATHAVAASTEHCHGDPATELLARVAPGDLLVITTHGRGAAQRWQIGTVAEKLLRHATVPVALVRADAP
jgi:nucleotide-binding universal stress UspA family protein